LRVEEIQEGEVKKRFTRLLAGEKTSRIATNISRRNPEARDFTVEIRYVDSKPTTLAISSIPARSDSLFKKEMLRADSQQLLFDSSKEDSSKIWPGEGINKITRNRATKLHLRDYQLIHLSLKEATMSNALTMALK